MTGILGVSIWKPLYADISKNNVFILFIQPSEWFSLKGVDCCMHSKSKCGPLWALRGRSIVSVRVTEELIYFCGHITMVRSPAPSPTWHPVNTNQWTNINVNVICQLTGGRGDSRERLNRTSCRNLRHFTSDGFIRGEALPHFWPRLTGWSLFELAILEFWKAKTNLIVKICKTTVSCKQTPGTEDIEHFPFQR